MKQGTEPDPPAGTVPFDPAAAVPPAAEAPRASAAGGRAELTRADRHSAEVERLRQGFGLPIRMLPIPRSSRPEALREDSLRLNSVIEGGVADPVAWAFLDRHLPAPARELVDAAFRLRFEALWDHADLDALGSDSTTGLAALWRRRVEERAPWVEATRLLDEGLDVERAWRGLGVGDFDLSGRGRDYTVGMQYFQAARAYGVESLLSLFEGDGREDRLILDVLGGDGYILRIHEASRKLVETRFWIARAASLGSVDGDLSRAGAALAPGTCVVAVEEGSAAPGTADERLEWPARLLARGEHEVSISEPLCLSPYELYSLETAATAGRLELGRLPADLPQLLAAVSAHAASRPAGRRRVVTNDISPHMFVSAGLWGLAAREDARSLSRTFRPGALDGVVYAYGTHHVTNIRAAIEESARAVRPGGRIVMHDFLDEGQVGRWFHQVVDRHSRTGHPFDHLGPVQLAALLLLAGFRDVALYEMEDPFIFSVAEVSPVDAVEVACTYLLGMYGMGGRFDHDHECFCQTVTEILSYPEIGNLPLFSRDLVYVPRRATVAVATRPGGGADGPLSPADRELAERIDSLLATEPAALAFRRSAPPELLAGWFRADGTRWGISPDQQADWRRWRELQRRR